MAALDSLNSYNKYIVSIVDSVLNNDFLQDFNPTFLSSASFNVLKNLRKQEKVNQPAKTTSLNKFFNIVNEELKNLYHNGIINKDSSQIVRDSVAVRSGNIDKIQSLKNFLNLNSAKLIVAGDINKINLSKDILQTLTEYSLHFIFPNIVYDRTLTQEEIDQAKNNVSRYDGIVNENERIIAKHDRITGDAKLKIDLFRMAKGEEVGIGGKLLQLFGNILHIGSLLTLFTIYLFLFRKKIFYDNQKNTSYFNQLFIYSFYYLFY